MDTQDREYLTNLDISEANIDGLDAFQAVEPPADDVYDDDTTVEPVNLTVGQVATLRSALRAEANNMFQAIAASQAGLFPEPPAGWNNEIARLLGIENVLSEAAATAPEFATV
jgi:hypothetical protein